MLDDFVEKLVRTDALEYREGSFKLLGLDGFVLPSPTYTAMLEKIYQRLGEDAVLEILFETGVEHGEIAVEEVGRKNQASQKEFLHSVTRTGNLMGMGVIQIEVSDFKEGYLKMSIKGSPLGKAFNRSEQLASIDRPIHEFWRGVFHTISKHLFDSEIESEELECGYMGADKCIFTFETKTE